MCHVIMSETARPPIWYATEDKCYLNMSTGISYVALLTRLRNQINLPTSECGLNPDRAGTTSVYTVLVEEVCGLIMMSEPYDLGRK